MVTALPTCAPGEFQCNNGKCLLPPSICDGVFDCGFGDYSDEAECGELPFQATLILAVIVISRVFSLMQLAKFGINLVLGIMFIACLLALNLIQV